jgi:dipeptidyl aminopeptidase/acylaminoacyl peptidase
MKIIKSVATAVTVGMTLLVGSMTSQAQAPRGLTPDDLIMLDRIADPNLSPDGTLVAYQQRATDLAANKGIVNLWIAGVPPAGTNATMVEPHAVTTGGSNTSPRWRHDGRGLYFLSTRSGSSQVWQLDLRGGDARQVTHTSLDVGSFALSPDDRHLLVSMEVFTDCDTPECTRQRLDARTGHGAGQSYDELFVRHWDTWSDGTRSQLFAFGLDADGNAQGAPSWISRGVQGDVPSKPEGDDSEYAFTADSAAVIFGARVAGRTEPWSTNFDLYRRSVDGSGTAVNLTADNAAYDNQPAPSPDGKTLAYLAARRPGLEADRNAIMLKSVDGGAARELLPTWDRSASALKWSADGKTLYALADESGQQRLFAIDVARARVSPLTDQGTVDGYSVAHGTVVVSMSNLATPAQLYRLGSAKGRSLQMLTHANADRLASIRMADFESFDFPGWNGDNVQGYVMKPTDFQPGKKYPVAFIIHGGPQAALGNVFHYRWNAQTFAGAGFAVVIIEFHGTPGYGQAFTDAVSGHWGDRPLEDMQKGWAYALARYPFLDGGNACALGASFGGYSVDWIAGNWPSPQSGAWKCLVSHDGIFDNRIMYYSTDELWFEEAENGGTPWEHPENYERFNPLDHVAQWQVPMLIIQGGLDYRVPVEQGIGAFTALQRRGIASQLLYFPNENHWVLKPQDSLQWHDAVLGWLRRWTAASDH